MMPLSPLQEVLRLRGGTDQDAIQSDETEVTLDRDGKVVRGLKRMLLASRIYVVRTGREVEFKVDAPLRDFEHNDAVVVPYRCRLAVAAGADRLASAEAVATGCWHRELTPWEVLKEQVRLATEDWWRQQGARLGLPLKVALYQGRQALAACVARTLTDKGFQADVIAEITEEWDAPPLPLPNLAFPVRLSDYVDREFDLRLDLALEVVPVVGTPDPRHPKTHGEWADRVTACVRKAMLDSVSLARYHHDRAGVEAQLKAAIDADLAAFGRRCKWLTIKTEKPVYKTREQLDVRFTWQALHGRNVEFNARLEAAVPPEGAPAYLRHGAPDFGAWFKQLLPETTRRMLLTCDYTVLTPDYVKQLERRIEQEVGARAAEIGIKVQALVLQNELAEWRYLEPFDVDVPARAYESGVADLPIRFDMSIHGFFDNLDDIKDLTFPQDKVKAEIIQAAEAAAAAVARDIAMEEYLTGWERSAEQSGGPGVRERIANEVRNSLASRLKMRVSFVKPRQHDSELMAYVRMFERAKDMSFERIRFTPHDLVLQTEGLEVEARVRINGMSPAQALRLKQKNIQPADMEEALRQWLVAILVRTDTAEFQAAVKDEEEALRCKIEQALQHKAGAYYGAGITLPHLRVLPSLLLRMEDSVRLIENETRVAGMKTALDRIQHARDAIHVDLAHADALTGASRAGELAQMNALQESMAKLVRQGVAEGSETLQDIQAKIQALQHASGVRAALAPLNLAAVVPGSLTAEPAGPVAPVPAKPIADKPEPEPY